ncbi:MAG: hypothetical protein ACR2KK_00030 [Acidimicrobiales bacterium]
MQTELDVPTEGQLDTAARCNLLKALDGNARFRRDSLLGGIFHPGKLSYREISPTDSLHIVIYGDKVSAHVDEISPLRIRPDGSSRYAWGRVLAHNLLIVIGDAARRARGLHGDQRCNLHCQAEWVDDVADAGPVVESDGGCGDHGHDHEAA